MKINVDILWENLRDSFRMELRGTKNKELTLRRIEFFKPADTLSKQTLYLASGDILGGYRPDFGGMSFACVGKIPDWVYAQHDCTVLVIHSQIGIVDIFRAVAQVFFRYEAWENALMEVLLSSADLLEMVSLSVPIFGNPVQITDHQFNCLAYTNIRKYSDGKIENFDVDAFSVSTTPDILKILKNDHPKDRKKKKPYFYKDVRYCINLFVYERFVGNMQLVPSVKPLSPGDLALFEYLSGLVVEALKKYTKIASHHVHTRKSFLKSLLEGKPTDSRWLQHIAKSKEGKSDRCVCLRLQLHSDSYALPYETICQAVEKLLPGSVAFEHDNVIVVFLSIVDCPYRFDDCLQILEGFLENIDFIAGISDDFGDIQNAHHYFGQTGCAIEAGLATSPGKRHYLFSQYALRYCLQNAAGGMKAQFLCPRGLVRLRRRNDALAVDYWQTLEAYLDNNMNATQAAKQLFLHRTTMVQRLSRITEILGVDLEDPDMRLYVRLCMKLMDMAAED